ncbi:MAG TPA: S-methyl-5-thioribose-1-phosphate isomerase [Gemmatimonadales bacterium]
MRPLVAAPDGRSVDILDQALLPHDEVWVRLEGLEDVARAIATMQVRGAPLIGITAAYGVALAMRADASDDALAAAITLLGATRPTAINLGWALRRMAEVLSGAPASRRADLAHAEAGRIAEEEAAACRAIGDHGLVVLEALWSGQRSRRLQVMTHCNAGWLATLEYGTALAPVYRAFEEGIPVHVWVSETRPRNQGWLTAWELGRRDVPHTVIADNAAGHLLQRGEVDVVLVGTDRTTRAGDVANKVGTLLKALAARESGTPFYAAVPSSSIDWDVLDWRQIPIEARSAAEVHTLTGRDGEGRIGSIRLGPATSTVFNPAFDVTPAALVTGLITERGVCAASAAELAALFPERQ